MVHRNPNLNVGHLCEIMWEVKLTDTTFHDYLSCSTYLSWHYKWVTLWGFSSKVRAIFSCLRCLSWVNLTTHWPNNSRMPWLLSELSNAICLSLPLATKRMKSVLTLVSVSGGGSSHVCRGCLSSFLSGIFNGLPVFSHEFGFSNQKFFGFLADFRFSNFWLNRVRTWSKHIVNGIFFGVGGIVGHCNCHRISIV